MLIKRICDGAEFPSGYGVAYVNLLTREAVCLPIGLNLIVRLARAAYHWVRWSPSRREREILEAEERGRARGAEEARAALQGHDGQRYALRG